MSDNRRRAELTPLDQPLVIVGHLERSPQLFLRSPRAAPSGVSHLRRAAHQTNAALVVARGGSPCSKQNGATGSKPHPEWTQ